ncbi:MAG TPA: monovalent cation/H+ antiporter complex subunit F [Egibacteraceae bacterium]
MTTVTTVAMAGLVAAGLLCLLRLLRGRSLADRVVALDALLLVVVSGIAVMAVRRDSDTFLNVLVVTALVSFIGTVTVARFIERRGT